MATRRLNSSLCAKRSSNIAERPTGGNGSERNVRHHSRLRRCDRVDLVLSGLLECVECRTSEDRTTTQFLERALIFVVQAIVVGQGDDGVVGDNILGLLR